MRSVNGGGRGDLRTFVKGELERGRYRSLGHLVAEGLRALRDRCAARAR